VALIGLANNRRAILALSRLGSMAGLSGQLSSGRWGGADDSG
jgi:hypothetical protein